MSIQQQTFKDFELLLVDDGSTDGSSEICDDFSKKDGRIKTIHQANGGVSSARNTGLSQASGKYITFVDADDWIEPSLFEECMQNMINSKADVLYHGIIKDIWKNGSKEESVKKGPVTTGIFSKKTLKEYLLTQEMRDNVFSYIFTRELVDRIHFDTQMPYAEDNVFVMQALAKAHIYCFIQTWSYHYNARMGSAAYRWQPDLISCYQKSLKETKTFFETIPFSEFEMNQLMSVKSVNAYASLIYNLCLPTCTLKTSEKLKLLKRGRNKFQVDYYKKFYKLDTLSLFEKMKTIITFLHLEGILILLGPLYVKKN